MGPDSAQKVGGVLAHLHAPVSQRRAECGHHGGGLVTKLQLVVTSAKLFRHKARSVFPYDLEVYQSRGGEFHAEAGGETNLIILVLKSLDEGGDR